ncbi:hypothetical protein Amet_2073 [Alkaliphilus metalliredigens QYMF]|uniref:Uncharacterized protein n=1 Tax=Alkaliphilus metalliredigens (strain QYMF) TaxID=293826 RepID=A6TPW5_ALKMQ|nr:hypothetical protein [Alkaliphilus metalliredigens]ABR48233.1 hypothetical protein Amet_2073 [Alkaliphilus metalliredigens QYMF]
MKRKRILDANAVKAMEKFKMEMGSEIGTPEDDYIDDEYLYVHTGDLIPREIIEEAERQFANQNEERLD